MLAHRGHSSKAFLSVQGFVLVEVGDGFNGGGDGHSKRMKQIRGKYVMGRWMSTRQPGGGVFAGRRAGQVVDWMIASR